ncbi:alpha-D-ribose 1-methylphosphonate 5-triphosphate diphosphatase [Parasedimentitalea huanghaiensis]|uniref:Alpha-D-ribose 1-methylphosphonate 5-triphosphate diphosphatase n=1 Tax=Parasedimentitalea huanghaiensis TaxID=2682100 RepID=A0A6L6W942_9RHOB|nr:alpha-D-ribose 1-methylphosphonate 5-triphosphate diphosphatase [Zongyanglinia huanghaiensis]MVO14343.1 alpha-D-ribose 1-methylphosphonate 5-triphosphate diphosphatase [Zongyanglinia huanghaiensis]
MTQDTILTNASIILSEEVIHGTIRLQDGLITDISSTATGVAGAIDLEGDFVAPGMVELHTDNLERHLSPRPKVDWPHRAAIIAHDRELAGTGITTVFDALRVGSIVSDQSKHHGKYARKLTTELLALRESEKLRISHHIHLRAEICSETLTEELAEFGPEDRIGIVSMMDHTPGQRQFTDVQKYKDYACGKHNLDDAGFDEHVSFLYGLQSKFGKKHEAATVAEASRFGAKLASHDDTTTKQVEVSHSYGVSMAEFPTTLDAADACHAKGISTIMGAPNIIRGGSHSGNVAARELAERDRLDILSSDYVPAGLLIAAVQLGNLWGDIARGLSTVTRNPANAVGLLDRGQLEIGKRADLIRFGNSSETPELKGTWSAGTKVF